MHLKFKLFLTKWRSIPRWSALADRDSKAARVGGLTRAGRRCGRWVWGLYRSYISMKDPSGLFPTRYPILQPFFAMCRLLMVSKLFIGQASSRAQPISARQYTPQRPLVTYPAVRESLRVRFRRMGGYFRSKCALVLQGFPPNVIKSEVSISKDHAGMAGHNVVSLSLWISSFSPLIG